MRTSDASSVSTSSSGIPVTAAMPCFVNVLPSTDPPWTSRRSSAERPSSRAATRACSVSGTSSVSIGPVTLKDGPVVDEQPAVEQHPNGLDGIERDALGAAEDLPCAAPGQARDEAVEQALHRAAASGSR